MNKTIPLLIAVFTVSLFFAPSHSWAQSSERVTITQATAVLNEVMRVPEQGIPEALLKNAYGIAVFPGVVNVALGVGGQRGEGILVVRTPDGSWSDPSFLRLTGGSLGAQVGASSNDIVLVFKTPRSVQAIQNGNFTMGAGVSVAAGPVGRYATAGTDTQLNAEIYSYARSRGLFVGASLNGSMMRVDHAANVAFYRNPSITTADIFSNRVANAPRIAHQFTCALAGYTGAPARACA